MLETLGTATSITGVGLLTTPTTTSLKSVETVKNEKAGEEEYDINAFKMGTAVAASITTTVAPTYQNLEYHRVTSNVQSQMAIVECTSEEEIDNGIKDLDRMLELEMMFEETAKDSLGELGDAKKPYTK